MAENRVDRCWCAVIQYPDRKPVFYGVVAMPTDAKMHDVESSMMAAILERLPEGFKIVDLVPGMMVFVSEKEEQETTPAS